MRWLGLIGLVAFGLALASEGRAAPKAPQVLQPTTQWVLNYAEDSCRLSRSFGEGNDTISVLIEQFEPGDLQDITLAGRRITYSQLGNNIRFAYGPGRKFTEVLALGGALGREKLPTLSLNDIDPLGRPTGTSQKPIEYPMLTPADEATLTQIEFFDPATHRFVLNIGPMQKTFAAMHACTRELVRSWGFDPEITKTYRQPAKPQTYPGHWIQTEDYPQNPLLRGVSGRVRFRMSVDAKGTATGCAAQPITRTPEFTKLVCQLLLKRARFKPAIDANGNPVAGYYVSAVLFLAS